ncbi:kinase-like protein, partial [Schizopora paradoxa]
HPNVLKFFGLSVLDNGRRSIALVSQWMIHGNLLDFVRRNRCSNKPDLVTQVGMGLIYLHLVDIIHGDLKCSNILVNDAGNPQLSDFGLSTVEPFQTIISGSTSFSGGNPRWSAPELIFPNLFGSSGKSTRESDVYAFGMTAIELFTEEKPFHNVKEAVLYGEIAVNSLGPA